jgi:hypothetical protein
MVILTTPIKGYSSNLVPAEPTMSGVGSGDNLALPSVVDGLGQAVLCSMQSVEGIGFETLQHESLDRGDVMGYWWFPLCRCLHWHSRNSTFGYGL